MAGLRGYSDWRERRPASLTDSNFFYASGSAILLDGLNWRCDSWASIPPRRHLPNGLHPMPGLRTVALLLLTISGVFGADKPNGDWAFHPIKPPVVPVVPEKHKAWVRTPVDAFVLEKLLANGLTPSAEADRRTLARRLFVDLTGLPPTPDELDAFLKDTSKDSYEKLVDRLLASPRYGERWARHWLDVAHYADSHGQDQDRFRPNAWPYRDWVITSLNADKPYSRFVKEQLAGDVLWPTDPDAIVATGFLAAGPWDESGLRDINENALDRQVARVLDRDDIVTTVMTSFAGLTVHCARCHDHKFDPIPTADYYSLQAVFAGIDKAEREYDTDPATAKRRLKLTEELAAVRDEKAEVTADRLAAVVKFEQARAAAQQRWQVVKPDAVSSRDGATLTVQADHSVLSGGKAPDRDVYTVSFTAELKGVTGLRVEVLTDDSLPHKGPGRQDNGNLHLSEVRVTTAPKGKPEQAVNVKLKSAAADFNQDGWGIARAIDGDPKTAWGIYPRVGKPHHASFAFATPVSFDGGTTFTVALDQLHGERHLIGRFRISITTGDPLAAEVQLPEAFAVPVEKRTAAQKVTLARWVWEQQLEKDIKSLPLPAKVYCGTNRFAPDGSFKPAATPRPIHILKRGDVTKPGKEAKAGAVEAVEALPARFTLKNANDEGERRAALADWLTADANPLTWRVIVNRAWHYHFGRGIVDTPNDLGAMGGVPSHPELLDWLANDFRTNCGSLKKLHKLIVTSSTYRQAVTHDPAAAAKDADNRLLWQMNRTRLDAESVRDAVLLAAGRLDDTMHGPPVKHFLTKPGIHVTPESDYDKFDVNTADARRRSIYRFVFRTKPDPFLAGLDCPDASASAPVRSVSVGAPQALAMWNNKFVLANAEHLAAMAEKASGDAREQVLFAAKRVLLRVPTAEEEAAWVKYAANHGLANLCRVLFNSSEFTFVE
jgi:hypothetical protein